MCLLDGTDSGLEKVTSTNTPFYAAPDYKTSDPLGGAWKQK
jgi:hypothetical protein